MQERLEAAVAPALVQALAEESDSEAEDFELLDQSELEQLEGELGLDHSSRAETSKPSKPSSGFLSKLLGRQWFYSEGFRFPLWWDVGGRINVGFTGKGPE